MSYGSDDEPAGRLPPVFQRLGNHSLSAPSTVSEEPRHLYSEQPLPPPPPQPSSNGHLGIRIASRPTFMQTQHFPQSNPLYMSYSPQAATSAVLHQERSYYSSTHSAPPMSVHDYGLPSSPSSISMVPASESAPTQFVRDIGGIKDPTLNRGQVFSFLGNKQSTPYHYSPYSEDKIQWGNKGASSSSSSSPSSHANHAAAPARSSSPHGGSQASSPSSSTSSETPYHRKDSRRDVAKNIKITSYKQQQDHDEDAEEHHAVIRKVTMSSTDSRSVDKDRHHEREHSNEDRRSRSRQSSSGSGDKESSHIVRQNDFYVPDYEKRPLPPRAALTGRVRQRNRSASPDRHRSSRNISRSPPRQSSRSINNATGINDRLNLSQVNSVAPVASSASSNGSSSSKENAEGAAASSTLYQNKTWVNPSEKLPLSKKFTPKEQLPSSEPAEPSKATADVTHKSYNKTWIKPTEEDTTPSSPVSKAPRRDLRYRQPISSGPLPPSKKFSSGAKTSVSATAKSQPAQSTQSSPAKPKEKPIVIANANANKQKNAPSSTAAATAATAATAAIKPAVAKPVQTPAQPKATSTKTNVAQTKPPSTVSNTSIDNTTKATSATTSSSITTTSATTTTTINNNNNNSAAKTAANPTVGTFAASTIDSNVKTASKEPASCSRTTINGVSTNETTPKEDRIIKEEPGTNEKKLSDFTESVNNGMDVNNKQTGLPQEDVIMKDVSTAANQEKRPSDTNNVPELIRSKKRRVSFERNGVANGESLYKNEDLMEVDSVQNNAESTCSSSVNSFATTVSDSADTLTKAYQANSTAPIPMVVDVAPTDSSSNQLHVPTPAKETTLIPSKTSLSNLNSAVYEKEDILEQIFGDGYSRDVTPEVIERAVKKSTGKSSRLNEGNVGNHVNKSNIQDTTAKTTSQRVEEIPNQMTLPSNTTSTNTAVTPSEAKNNVVTHENTPKKETEAPKITHDTKSPVNTPPPPPPSTASTRKKSRRLPAPWIARMSDMGDIYYYNTETLETRDIRPVS